MKYKVGDKIRIKSLDWYNRHTNGTEVDCGAYPFTSDMKEFCGQERIIANICQECYFLLGINNKFAFTDEMIEGLVEEEQKVFNMNRTFINFNGTLINTHYIKKIFKSENSHVTCNSGRTFHDKYYEIRINVDGTPGTHVETYRNEKDRNDRFSILKEILTINYQ